MNVIKMAEQRRVQKVEGIKLFSKVVLCSLSWGSEHIALNGIELEKLFSNVIYGDSRVSTFYLPLSSSDV